MGYLAYVRGISLIRRKKKADELGKIDFLTRLNNRRSLFDQVELRNKDIHNSNEITTLIMIDLDHFKRINDHHGHDHGDAVLVQISQLLKSSLRQTDIIARWGGEEFLVLMPKTDLEQGLKLAEKIRKNIADTPINYCEFDHHVTATLGVASYGAGANFEQTIQRADAALYKGKEQGRNRVVQVTSAV